MERREQVLAHAVHEIAAIDEILLAQREQVAAVAPFGRRGQAKQELRAEIGDQLAVGRRGGVVELVDDEVVEGVRREALQMLAPAKDPGRNRVATLAADASRRAALLVAYIRPVCALLAPCRAGASTPKVPTLFRPGSYAFGSRQIRLQHPDP